MPWSVLFQWNYDDVSYVPVDFLKGRTLLYMSDWSATEAETSLVLVFCGISMVSHITAIQ